MKNRDWSKWAAIAEILSSVAIVLTLVFLAVQTSQNTDAINAQLVANRAAARAAIFAQVSNINQQSVQFHDENCSHSSP